MTRVNRKNYTFIDGKHGWIVQQVVDACVNVLDISEVDIRAIGEVHYCDCYEVVLWNHRRIFISAYKVFQYTDRAHTSAIMRRRSITCDTSTKPNNGRTVKGR